MSRQALRSCLHCLPGLLAGPLSAHVTPMAPKACPTQPAGDRCPFPRMSAFQNECSDQGVLAGVASNTLRASAASCSLPDRLFPLPCRGLASARLPSWCLNVTHCFHSGVGKANASSWGSWGPGPSTASGPPGRGGQSVPERVAEASGIRRDTATTPSKAPTESPCL